MKKQTAKFIKQATKNCTPEVANRVVKELSFYDEMNKHDWVRGIHTRGEWGTGIAWRGGKPHKVTLQRISSNKIETTFEPVSLKQAAKQIVDDLILERNTGCEIEMNDDGLIAFMKAVQATK